MFLKFGLLAAVSVLAFGQAQAAVITTTSIDAVSSQFTAINRGAANLLSGAGFVPPPGAFTVDATNTMWLTTPGDRAPSITFNLGGLYTLSSARIWNYNENNGTSPAATAQELGRGVSGVTIQTSTDDILFTTIANITLLQAPGTNNVDFSQIQALSGSAAYIRFTNLVSFNTVNGVPDNNFTGLSQVQFSGTAFSAETAIPEPFSAPLLVVGLAATFLLRRRDLV